MITFLGENTATSTTVTIPAHNIGDLILIFAYKTTTTAPSLASGFTSISTNTGDVNSFRLGYKFATSTSDTSGTWTSATQLIVQVYRGVSAIGASANGDATTSPGNIPALTLTGTNSLSWVVGFLGSKQGTSQATPSGMTPRAELKNSTTSMVDCWDTNGAVSSFTAKTSALGSSTDSYGCSVELEANPAVSTLVDTLQATTINGALWTTFNSGTGTTLASSAGITITPEVSTLGSDDELNSALIYDLTGSSAYLNVAQIATAADVETDFILSVNNGLHNSRLIIYEYSGTLYCNYENAGTVTAVANIAYNPSTMAWWRMRESSGTVYWDYSADGITWTNLGSVAVPIVISEFLIALTTYEDISTATPGAAIFSHFNTNAPIGKDVSPLNNSLGLNGSQATMRASNF